MVLAVPPHALAAFQSIMRAEEVEATVIGVFGSSEFLREHGGEHDRTRGADPAEPWLIVRYQGTLVGALRMDFLHEGLPKRRATATWSPAIPAPRATPAADDAAELLRRLAERLGDPTIASKAWAVRQYDHEVQGGAVVRPLCGPGAGPSDAAVLRPRLDSTRGIALGCGLAPQLFDHDPYWMAVAAIDEAIRNVVCVGGDPGETAILDNFCWGRCDDPQQLGALVRACQACHDAALAYGTPFISGKDSLNNEFALHQHDVEPLIATLERSAAQRAWAADWTPALPAIVARIRATQRLSIPGTLLISALSVVPDVRRCITADLKTPGAALLLLPGFAPTDVDLAAAARAHAAVAGLIERGVVRSCHDVSEGGWLTAAAEMALAGGLGARLEAVDAAGPFELRCAAYVLECSDVAVARGVLRDAGAAVESLGVVTPAPELRLGDAATPVAELRRAWQPR
jgi:phosphoribosylformylglycinamidine synthase